jgi:hypothetical protein
MYGPNVREFQGVRALLQSSHRTSLMLLCGMGVLRRWIGVVSLAVALGMLVAGLTVLKDYLRNLSYLTYWTGCLVITALAMGVAYADARAVQRRSREQRRELLKSTLEEIQRDATTRKGAQKPGGGK